MASLVLYVRATWCAATPKRSAMSVVSTPTHPLGRGAGQDFVTPARKDISHPTLENTMRV